jgi:hypothetical protein
MEFEQYEKEKQDLKKYILTLDKKCKSHFGPYNKYISPVKNIYSYANINDYKKRVIGDVDETVHARKNCKFITGTGLPDKKNRYYPNIISENECKKGRGFWDSEALHRDNKHDIGLCWKTEQDKICGEQNNVKLLKPYYAKFSNVTDDIIDKSTQCKETPGCKWEQQTKYTWDCIKGSQDKYKGPVMNPPKDLPLKENIGDYINKWYSSENGPKITELLGTGNRCKNIILEENLNPPLQMKFDKFINYRDLNPTKPKDLIILKQLMTLDTLVLFIKEWNDFYKLSDENFKKKYKNSVMNKFYNDMDLKQFDGDIPLKIESNENKIFPSIPQSVVNMVMKHVAQNNSKRRGILAWHSTGSGKTCTATGVIDAFWDTDRPIIFASSIDAIASNPDYKFHECAFNMYPRFQQGEFVSSTRSESLSLIAAAFKKKKIKFLSFAKLSHRVENAIEYKKKNKIGSGKIDIKHKKILDGDSYVDLSNAILIIDEVHNLFRPLANQKQEHEQLEKELLDPKKYPNLKIVILTATPGDNIPDILKLINMIRIHDEPIIKLNNVKDKDELDKFKNQIQGLISYFDMSSDTTKFPIVEDKQNFIKAPMGDIQFEKYVEVFKAVKADQKKYDVLAKKNQINKYWEPARKYSNMLFNFDKDMLLSDFSAKLPYLFDNIKKYPKDKQYIYSSFYTKMGYGGHGVVAIAKELDKLGYKKLTVKEAKKLNAEKKLPDKRKRYILAISTEFGEESGNTGENLHELLKIYNSPENKHGEFVHLMLASQGYNEGIDLKAVKHIHFFEPLVTMASDKQTLGRAARYCSHSDLDRDKGEWIVKVHRYMSEFPDIHAKIDKTPMIKKLINEIKIIENKIQEQPTSKAKKIMDIKKQIVIIKNKIKLQKATVKQLKILEDEYKLLLKQDNITINVKLLKDEIKKKKKDLDKLLAEPKKKTKTFDIKNIINIEQLIFDESRERMKELLTIYLCMKESAIDCKVLSKFHSSLGNKIKCM